MIITMGHDSHGVAHKQTAQTGNDPIRARAASVSSTVLTTGAGTI